MKTERATSLQRLLAGILCGLGLVLAQASWADTLRVDVEGRTVRFRRDARPYMDRGVWMLPARPVLDAGRIWNEWDPRQNELTVWTTFDRLTVSTNSYTVARTAGHRYILSRPVVVRGVELFAPVDFLELCLDLKAYYDRRAEVLSFGRASVRWHGAEPWDRWRDNRRYDDWWSPRDERRRFPSLTVQVPAFSYSRNVRVSGQWGGTSVRIRLYRSDGREAINRTVAVRDDRWFVDLSLTRDEYRVVVEGLVDRFVRETREARFSVR